MNYKENDLHQQKETSYVEQEVYDSMYRPKGITEPSEAFEFMDKTDREIQEIERDLKKLRNCAPGM